MRIIGFILALSVWPVSAVIVSSSSLEEIGATTIKQPGKHPPFTFSANCTEFIDTMQLKQSSWYFEAISQIRESEYEITSLTDGSGYVSPNSNQKFCAFYFPDRFRMEARKEEDWKLELTLKGIYSGNRRIYSPKQTATAVPYKNKLTYLHNGEFAIEYINSSEGLRQNFIIEKEPALQSETLSVKLEADKDWVISRVHPREIHFARTNGETIQKKITYNDLKVWDAKNKPLEAHFEIENREINIVLNVRTAVFPITIDPISTTTNWSGEGNQISSGYGVSVMSAGDVNGDGYSDVIIGAYTYDNPQPDEGRVFVYHGSATGLSATANWSAESDQASASFGTSVNTAGDVNGDGYSDVIIGALNYDNGNTDEGRAYLYYGSTSGLLAAPAWTYESDQTSANLGTVASAGDVNGDGYSDVMVGARLMNNGEGDEGLVFVFHGSPTGLSSTPNRTYESNQPGAAMGLAVSSAGDVNGDGYSDVIIGANIYTNTLSQEGRVWIYHGSATGLSGTPAITLNGGQASANYGNAVGCAGDVNGDGYSDILVSAPSYDNGQTNEGKVDLHYGSATGVLPSAAWTTEGGSVNFYLGSGIHLTGGDFDGDGYSDVLVGCQFYSNGQTNEGIGFMFKGSSGGLSTVASWSVESNQTGAYFGAAITSAGDVNGDGYSDLIVSATGYTNGENSEGAAFVYHGSADGLSASPNHIPDDADQLDAQFGVSVAGAGDVNGDGFHDVIIGAWSYDDAGNTNEGRAYVYHGSANGLNPSPNWVGDDADQAFCLFAETVASAGDVNGDGYSDVIIGADNYNDAGNSNEGRAFVYHGSAAGLSSSPDWIGDDANQANAFFGVSLNSAGDVNGDGYGDVIVGAIGITDGGNSNEGRAYLYYGSATGLSILPNSTPDDADQANAWFGWSVAGAGDINGDGYSDVIIGAPTFDEAGNVDEGRAFVYYGSAVGLSAAPVSTPDDADQPGAWFGESVAPAGDVNGDGFSDLIIGARLYDDAGNTDEGRAFVYYGSAGGLNGSAGDTPDDADQAGATFGISVASAGDVNGDGYSDVIIGARYYDEPGFTDEGRAFVYYGSPAGLNGSPGTTPDDANQSDAWFGYSVACAGDVNGDGYSDVIIGAYMYNDGPNTNEGNAYLYYGNQTGGLRNNLRLYNIDLVTPIQRSNIGEGSLFGAGLFQKSFTGRSKARLTWEIKQEGSPFSGIPITNSTAFLSKQSSWTDLGINGTELKNQVQKPGFQNKIRTRTEYHKATAITGQVYGPWRYPPGYMQGAHGMSSLPLPVRFISFTATKQGESARLSWTTANEEQGLQYEVLHSTDGQFFTVLTSINGSNLVINQYEWIHPSPSTGVNYYQIRASGANKETYTQTRMLQFGRQDENTSLYPHPYRNNQWLTVKGLLIKQNERTEVRVINSAGQSVWSGIVTAFSDHQIRLKLPPLANGIYHILVGSGKTRNTITMMTGN